MILTALCSATHYVIQPQEILITSIFFWRTGHSLRWRKLMLRFSARYAPFWIPENPVIYRDLQWVAATCTQVVLIRTAINCSNTAVIGCDVRDSIPGVYGRQLEWLMAAILITDVQQPARVRIQKYPPPPNTKPTTDVKGDIKFPLRIPSRRPLLVRSRRDSQTRTTPPFIGSGKLTLPQEYDTLNSFVPPCMGKP